MLDAVAVIAVTLAEVQPCKTYPCTDNDDSATLCAARSDAPDSINGRVCSCLTPGFSYRDDLLGCVGKWGSPWQWDRSVENWGRQLCVRRSPVMRSNSSQHLPSRRRPGGP